MQTTVTLEPVFQHHGDQYITVFGAVPHNPPQRASGRCGLAIEVGPAIVRLYPSADEMRELAALLLAAADTVGAA